MKNFLLLLAAIILVVPMNICYADSGAGSIATQLIAGPILAVLASISMCWKKFKSIFTGKKSS